MNSNPKELEEKDIQELIRAAELKSGKQIISVISHEMRNPLAIISSNIQLLKEYTYNLDDKIVNDTFLLCEEAIRSLTNFIGEIYFLNTAFKGHVRINIREIHLDSLLIDVVNSCSNSAFNLSRMEIQMPESPAVIYSDKELLKRILNQLVKNALNFSSDTVRIEVLTNEDELVVIVEDRGIGIPEDEKSLIFEPFKRCSNVRMISGSGIGLAIVKVCVELLEGNIDFESTQNQGTKFIIKIRNHGL